MNIVEPVDPATVVHLRPIAESDQFAIYALGNDTYLLVQRHVGTPWVGVRLSGDGVFRAGSLLVDAMRHLYRSASSQRLPNHVNPLHAVANEEERLR
jgi:hypothetical protein